MNRKTSLPRSKKEYHKLTRVYAKGTLRELEEKRRVLKQNYVKVILGKIVKTTHIMSLS